MKRVFAALLLVLYAAIAYAAPPVTTVRGGQVFVTWTEDGSSSYVVKRDGTTIATVAPNSGTDLYTGQRFPVVVAAGQGLFVDTPHTAGNHSYTINNSAASSVTTDPANGILPVLIQDAHTCNGINTCYSYLEWEDLANFPTAIMGGQHRRFDVVVTSNAPATNRPLFLDLHSAPQHGYFEPNTFIDNAWNGVFVFPVDFSYNFGPDPYSNQWQVTTAWFGYLVGTTPTKATEDRVVRYTQWVIAQPQFKVDPNRVYVKGASMGGGGSMKVGFHYPNIFAGIASSIAWVAPQDWGNMWGGMSGHNVSGTSIPFDTYEDGQAWVEANNPVPPITLTFRQDDNIIPQGHYATFMPALDAKHVAYVATWQSGGHNMFWHDAGQPDDITRYRKNEAYIAFSGISTNSAYAANGADGQRNAVPDYSSSLHSFGTGTEMVDTATRFAVTVRGTAVANGFATIRNAQAFKPAVGSSVHWQQGTWSGDVTVASDGSITVPVGINTTPSVLELGQTSQQFPVITTQNIPDFAAFPTKTAVANGPWMTASTWSPSGVPTATDVVQIPVGKTVTLSSGSATAKSIGIYGVLRQTNATLTATNIIYYTGGLWEIGTEASPTSATVIIRNTPIDPATDPQHWGIGIIGAGGKFMAVGQTKTPFLAVNGDVTTGTSAITLASAPSGWLVGDQLGLPATDQWYLDAGWYVKKWEAVSLTSVTGANLVTSSRAFSHTRPRKQDGSVASQFHIGNLTRSIVIKSEDPNGTRGHFLATDRSDVTIEYVEFDDFGRTTADPIDSQNTLGRYAVHFHHLTGPVTAQPNGRQFTVLGAAINRSTKWALDVHDSNDGLVKDTVMWDAQGASLMTETGNEIGNVFDHNFYVVALGPGNGGYGTQADWASGGTEREDAVRNPFTGDKGWGGSCYWASGVMNDFINNVCANSNGFGVYIYNTNLGIINVRDFQGADHMQTHAVDSQTLDLGRFENNTIYASADGVTIWNIREFGNGIATPCGGSTLLNTTLWGIGRYGYYGYSHNCVTFNGWFQYGDLSPWSWSPYVFNRGIWFGDYPSPNTTLTNIHIEGLRNGIQAPFKAGDVADIYGNAGTPFVISNSYLANEWNIAISPMFAVGGGDGSLSQRHTFINNVTYGPMNTSNFPGGPQWTPCNICMSLTIDTRNSNLIQLDEVTVNGYNGTSENFRAYYVEQAPDYIVPQSSAGVTAAPVAGLTNAQTWAQYGIAIAGAIAPCTTTHPGVQGFACPTSTGGHPAPRPASTGPVATPEE